MKINIEFYLFKLIFQIRILNFSFNKQFWFWNNFPIKVYFGWKHKKMIITIEFFIFELA